MNLSLPLLGPPLLPRPAVSWPRRRRLPSLSDHQTRAAMTSASTTPSSSLTIMHSSACRMLKIDSCDFTTLKSTSAWPVVLLLSFSVIISHPVLPGGARAFDWFGAASPTISKDPVEPFTLYGSIFKKYFLENIVDGRVVSRKKGFTSTACVNALDANKETPELQGIPAGLKVVIIGEPLCSKSEGGSREATCMPACQRACVGAISRHLAEVTKQTGYVLDAKDNSKVVESCSSQCTNECLKPGKTTSFIYPFRPSK